MSSTPSMAAATRRLVFLLFVDLLILGSSVSEVSNRKSFEWQTLTKSNFSAQIRTQPHLLLLVTLPWSGKSRSLMREVSNKISHKPDKYKDLKLIVVYKNLEKTLADIVGATDEEATLICYRDSTPYRYRGRFRAQNVLASVYHLISQRPNEFPIKPIKTRESLLSFLSSTDRSFLLLETCGWSTRLLHQSNQSMLNKHILENGMLLTENLAIKAKDIRRDETLKDLNYEKLPCDLEFELSGNLWPGDTTWYNKSASILENGGGDNGISCSTKEFQQFKLFFSKLRILAGDHFLPPEKQRFGFLSDPSLFPLLGVQTIPGWLLSVQYAGCPKCSGMIRESGELKNAVLTLRSVVNELQDEGHDFEPTLPADKSSIILFIDRSSESAKIRRRSVSALEVFRKVALSSHSLKPETRRKGSGLKSILRSSDLNMRVSVAPKSGKYKNHMAFMITKDGEAVALGNLADSLQSQSTDGILSYLLQKSQLKGPKMSMVAAKAGFQLLSNDFDVNVVDSSFLEKKIDLSDETMSAQLNLNSDLAGKSTNEVSGSELVSVTDNDNVFSEHSEPVDKHTAASSQRDEIGCSEIANIDSNVSAEEVKEADLVVSEDNKADLFKGRGGNLELPVRLDQQHFLRGEDMSQAHEHTTNEDSDLHLGVDPDIFSEPSSSFVHENFQEAEHQFFEGFFYYSDGGYQLLRSLSSTSHVPSAIIVDPILRQHFVYPEDKTFNHSSLVNFVQDYFNGKLSSYHMLEPDVFTTKDFPRPPFVNLDFHEADSIPRVTTNTFSAMALGFDQFNKQSPELNVVAHNVSPAWGKDVLVLFGNAWCGFCLKMELPVREVYRAFKGYSSSFHNGSELGHAPAVDVDVSLDEMPSIFFMDCTLNDCSAILHSLNQSDLYPALFLFPAENKSAIPYQGELSVSGIIEFLAAHGANSHFLYGSVGKLWTRPQQDHVSMNLLHEDSSAGLNSQPLIKVHDHHEVPKDSTTDLPIESRPYNESNVEVSVGSVLMATNKLINSPPFDNSTILIVKADKNIGFQGVIVNKRISWDVLNNANEEFLSLKQATLSFGGPLLTHGMPLVSIVRSPADEGYLEVFPDFHFGDQVATTHAIKRINSGDRSADDYWFFLGYSSWNWDQLFDELSEGAWNLSNYHLAELKWLGS